MKDYIRLICFILLVISLFCVAGYVDYLNSEKGKLDSKNKANSENCENFDKGYKAGQLDAMNNVWKYKKIDGKIFKQDL